MTQIYKIVDTTSGNTLGHVEANTERGAKIIAVWTLPVADSRFIVAIPVILPNEVDASKSILALCFEAVNRFELCDINAMRDYVVYHHNGHVDLGMVHDILESLLK